MKFDHVFKSFFNVAIKVLRGSIGPFIRRCHLGLSSFRVMFKLQILKHRLVQWVSILVARRIRSSSSIEGSLMLFKFAHLETRRSVFLSLVVNFRSYTLRLVEPVSISLSKTVVPYLVWHTPVLVHHGPRSRFLLLFSPDEDVALIYDALSLLCQLLNHFLCSYV